MEKERSLRDAILAELGDESKRRDEVIEGVGETRDVISHALKRMLRDGEVIQPSHGSYAKPQHGAAYTPTDEAIIKAMLTLPGHRATIPELMAVTCRDRIPIMDNAKRMVGKGLLKRLTSGHGVVARFELAPNVLRQIERGQPIRLGSKLISFALPKASAVSAPEVINDRRSIRALTSR